MTAVRKGGFQYNAGSVDELEECAISHKPHSGLKTSTSQMSSTAVQWHQLFDFHFQVQINSAQYGSFFFNPCNYDPSFWPPSIHFLMSGKEVYYCQLSEISLIIISNPIKSRWYTAARTARNILSTIIKCVNKPSLTAILGCRVLKHLL